MPSTLHDHKITAKRKSIIHYAIFSVFDVVGSGEILHNLSNLVYFRSFYKHSQLKPERRTVYL